MANVIPAEAQEITFPSSSPLSIFQDPISRRRHMTDGSDIWMERIFELASNWQIADAQEMLDNLARKDVSTKDT